MEVLERPEMVEIHVLVSSSSAMFGEMAVKTGNTHCNKTFNNTATRQEKPVYYLISQWTICR